MGKTCLAKLAGNILVTCDIPTNGVKYLYLMHAEDVTLTFATDGTIRTATFAAGTKSYKIEGYKQNIQITSAIKTMDASNKVDATVMFKIPAFPTARGISLLGGRFYAMSQMNDLRYMFIGSISPLECSGYDYDSNANGGLVTVTLTSPDGSAGNFLQDVESVAINEIISKSA